MFTLREEEWKLNIASLALWRPPAQVCEQLAHVMLHTGLSSGADTCSMALLQE